MTAVEGCFDGNTRQDSESFVITSDFNRPLQQCCNFLVQTNNRDQKDLCLIYGFLYLILIRDESRSKPNGLPNVGALLAESITQRVLIENQFF